MRARSVSRRGGKGEEEGDIADGGGHSRGLEGESSRSFESLILITEPLKLGNVDVNAVSRLFSSASKLSKPQHEGFEEATIRSKIGTFAFVFSVIYFSLNVFDPNLSYR